jgi:uncharacterized protein
LSFWKILDRLSSEEMKVVLNKIPAGNKHYTIEDTGWFPAEDFTLSHIECIEIDLQKSESGSAVLDGKMRLKLELRCDRCGEAFPYALAVDFHYLFRTGEDVSLQIQDLECSDDDCNTVYLDEPVIDIDEVLREQVVLEVPFRRVCSENCKGLCPGCGAVLAREACRCPPEAQGSPFAVLKKLKKH